MKNKNKTNKCLSGQEIGARYVNQNACTADGFCSNNCVEQVLTTSPPKTCLLLRRSNHTRIFNNNDLYKIDNNQIVNLNNLCNLRQKFPTANENQVVGVSAL